MNSPVSLQVTPFHLGLGATVDALEAFDATPEWYERYSELTASDGREGRLVSMHTFDEGWAMWEMHPDGHELVVCTDGEMELLQDDGTSVSAVTLHRGQAVVNAPGVWHTANVAQQATALFITAGRGTQVRPRTSASTG